MKTYKILFFLALLLTACGDDEIPNPEPEPTPTLPAITMEGLNTFGCYINDSLWVAEIPPLSEITGLRKIDAGYNTETKNFGIFAQKKNVDNSINEGFNFAATVEDVGPYLIEYYDRTYRNYNLDCITYELDTLEERSLEILFLDTTSRIISGTFEFTVFDSECQDTFRITDGRFDVPY